MMESRIKMKTYSHLAELRRIPSDYELASTQLLYNRSQAPEVKTPAGEWYHRHQRQTQIQCSDWEWFRDPRETTYTEYTARQKKREEFVDGIFAAIESAHGSNAYEPRLSPEWKSELASWLGVIRYPCHALQMLSAYVAHLSPTSQMVITGLFQTADEMRRIQRFAYRLALLRQEFPDAAERGKQDWQTAPQWQPLRRCIEKLLVTYDWDEALVALNLCLKPRWDELILTDLAVFATHRGDHLFPQILRSLREDSEWHQQCAQLWLEGVLARSPTHAAIIESWKKEWAPRVNEAIAPLSARLRTNLNDDGGGR